MKILVTGTAGFIGFHLAKKLSDEGYEVVGLDIINEYYDKKLKLDRLNILGISPEPEYGIKEKSSTYPNFSFIKLNLGDKQGLLDLFKDENFDAVCNLAAQAGVRYSLENPDTYIDSNIVGFFNILECCKQFAVKNLSYASSSSVYGLNENIPFSADHSTDHPVSLYAASKKSNEILAHAYSHLHGIQTTGLRFFTVYGPWGRPDMALFIFTKAALEGEDIDVYNFGKMSRDFTYIDDIVNGIKFVIDNPATSNKLWSAEDPISSSSSAPFKIYNIGCNSPVNLLDFILIIEKRTGKKISKNLIEIQQGDVPSTFADISSLQKDFGYNPTTNVETGVEKFISWFIDYYKMDL
tara:strand:- start:20741 stop:21796 length:1056 start_codon:yes stop_codon:yes gene_type:complete